MFFIPIYFVKLLKRLIQLQTLMKNRLKEAFIPNLKNNLWCSLRSTYGTKHYKIFQFHLSFHMLYIFNLKWLVQNHISFGTMWSCLLETIRKKPCLYSSLRHFYIIHWNHFHFIIHHKVWVIRNTKWKYIHLISISFEINS